MFSLFAESENSSFWNKFITYTFLGQPHWLNQGLLYRWTEHSADFFFEKITTEGGKKAPKLHPGGGFFGP